MLVKKTTGEFVGVRMLTYKIEHIYHKKYYILSQIKSVMLLSHFKNSGNKQFGCMLSILSILSIF